MNPWNELDLPANIDILKKEYLSAILKETMTPEYWESLSDKPPKEELPLFLQSQTASRHLQKSLVALKFREKQLEMLVRDVQQKLKETHEIYLDIRNQRKIVEEQTVQINAEIADCDRLLKSTPTPPRSLNPSLKIDVYDNEREENHHHQEEVIDDDDDDDSPWEDSKQVDNHHIRSSLVFNSTFSPMNRHNHGNGAAAFFIHEPSSPKSFTRSRTSSGTSAGNEEEDSVLFGTLSSSLQNTFSEKVKDLFGVKKPLELITEVSSDETNEEEDDETF